MQHLLARSLAGSGRWDEAVSARRASLALGFSSRWRSWKALAAELAETGDTAGALAALDSAMARTDEPAALDTLAAAAGALASPTRDP
jgi:hypothetical protein